MDLWSKAFLAEEELMPLLRECLAAGRRVRYLPFRGVSMLPMLRQGIDTVEIAPLPQKLKKYDLPVYQYPSGKIVMHRVVGVRDDYYLCLGDNTYAYEKVTHDQMIGVVSAFKRGERRIEVSSPMYRIYCQSWVMLYPLRRFYKRGKSWIKSIVKQIVK
jgi:hypothetical protein